LRKIIFTFLILITFGISFSYPISISPYEKEICITPGENKIVNYSVYQGSEKDRWFYLNLSGPEWVTLPNNLGHEGEILVRNTSYETLEIEVKPDKEQTYGNYSTLINYCNVPENNGSNSVGIKYCIYSKLNIILNETCIEKKVENNIPSINETIKTRSSLPKVNAIWIFLNIILLIVVFAVYLKYSKD